MYPSPSRVLLHARRPNTDRVYAFLDELSHITPEEALRMAGFFDATEMRRTLACRHVERLRKGEMRVAWEHARDRVADWGAAAAESGSKGLPVTMIKGRLGAGIGRGQGFPAAIDAITAYVFERQLLPFEVAALLAPWHAVRPGEPRAR